MACSLTIPQVVARSKTVTRRRPETWQGLKTGDDLALIEKGMGLKKGERQVVLAVVTVTCVTVERLSMVSPADCHAEGFPEMSPGEFIAFWLASHGLAGADPLATFVRRIAWDYGVEEVA